MAIASALSSMIGSGVEGFEASKQKQNPGYTVPKSWINFVVFLILLMAVAFFGQLLWNELLSKYITVLKPLPTIWHAVAMYIAIDIFFGNA
jgi:hypothetical protein|tara:strand:- start:7611 stop:7883 length:273 start_codon:yes stop_codon:yes gene_type:complete